MLQPKGIAEQLLFSTVRLAADNGSSGTGFFFNFKIENYIIPVIITNKHVVNNHEFEAMTFQIHLSSDGKTDEGSIAIRLDAHWLFHPDQDLCFAYCQPILEEIPKRTGKQVFFKGLSDDYIYDEEKLKTLSMLEEVVMIGYPIGLYDEQHNFPIFRHGCTAAHPGYDFNSKGIGLIDMACFPGSSGSPVFVLNEGSYNDPQGNMYIGQRVIFLGTLSSGPIMNSEGEIVPKEIPMVTVPVAQTRTMINLGYYIKSYELKKFIPIIEKDLRRQIENEKPHQER